MPRPPRRGPGHVRDQAATTTPTRPGPVNAITATIPPFMLETPPHAPFLTAQNPPSNPPTQSPVPDARGQWNRQVRIQEHTPTGHVAPRNAISEQPQLRPNPFMPRMPVEEEEEHEEQQSLIESVQPDADDAKQLLGLRDISSLATWTLSSAKPGCALPQLRHPNTSYFWQSDGPQPHSLTLHFFKLVAIVKMRIFLDFGLDESYTPTKMKFFAGMLEGGLVEFGSWEVSETADPETGEMKNSVESLRGWVDIPLKGVGGREKSTYADDNDLHVKQKDNRHSKLGGVKGHTKVNSRFDLLNDGTNINAAGEEAGVPGDVLKAMVVQIRICENYQNGKDTHVRGFQVFARDEAGMKEMRKIVKKKRSKEDIPTSDDLMEKNLMGLQPAEWMGEPEIR